MRTALFFVTLVLTHACGGRTHLDGLRDASGGAAQVPGSRGGLPSQGASAGMLDRTGGRSAGGAPSAGGRASGGAANQTGGFSSSVPMGSGGRGGAPISGGRGGAPVGGGGRAGGGASGSGGASRGGVGTGGESCFETAQVDGGTCIYVTLCPSVQYETLCFLNTPNMALCFCFIDGTSTGVSTASPATQDTLCDAAASTRCP